MLSNYFKIAWRNLLRQKAFSIINIFGLAIGIATCLIIMLYVQNELSYDRYNQKAGRIVRVVFRGFVGGGGEIKEANVMPPVASTLKKDYPEVLDATRILGGGVPLITYGDKSFKEDEMAFVDPNFFQVFSIPLLQGNINLIVMSATVSFAQCDKKVKFRSSKTDHVDSGGNLTRTQQEDAIVQVGKSTVAITVSGESRGIFTIKSMTCDWKVPFKEGKTTIKASMDGLNVTLTFEGG